MVTRAIASFCPRVCPLLAIIAFDSQLQCFTYLHWGPGPRCTQGELDVPYELCLTVWAGKQSRDVLRKIVTFKTRNLAYHFRCRGVKTTTMKFVH